MRWYHLFVLPRYISGLEDRLSGLEKTAVLYPTFKQLEQEVVDQKQEFSYFKDTIEALEKKFAPLGAPNEIEDEDDGSIEIDENYRIPIVDGISIREEGKSQDSASSLRIYSQAHPEVITKSSLKAYGSRQSKKKIN
jgi:hypothetical protein